MFVHSLRVTPRSLAVLAGALVLAPLVTLGYLFAAGDYVTRPGSLVYYLGISALVRNVQIPAGAQGPEYFGSVGDGNKPPQSQLSFKVQPEKADAAWDDVTQQLRKLALHPANAAAGQPSAISNQGAVSPGVREAEYTSAKGDLLRMATYSDTDSGIPWIRFELTHFD